MQLLRPVAVARAATVFIVTAGAAGAQQSSGIRGTVTNLHTHAPISGARVAVTTPERVAITDERGMYLLRDVPAGTYKVYVSAIGRAADSSTVTVAAGAPATHDVSLGDGSLLLSSVIISATRTPIEAAKVASTVNVLTPEQVRQSPAREAQDMLREIPAVELPRTSSLVGGTAQIVSIRGVDEGRTAVLFDGVPVNDAWGEWIDWGRVPKAMLDRVEVVEGGTSSLYGNGAMGGLISFFSRPLAPGAMQMQVDGGSRNARHAFVAAGLPLAGALTANVNGDYQEKGGYRLIANGGPIDMASNVIQRNSYARINYAPSADWSAYMTGHLFGDTRWLGTPLTYATRDQRSVDFAFNHTALLAGTLGIRAWDGRQIEQQRASNIRSLVARSAEDSSLRATIPSHDWGASAQWTRTNAWRLESFSVGGDFRHYQGDFNEVDFNTTCPGPSCGAVTRTVSSGGDQTLSGAFIQAIAAPMRKLRLEASGRVDQWKNNNGRSFDNSAGNAAYPNETAAAFSPRVGARYQLHTTFSVHAAGYKAFRAPNLAELYRKQISATQITAPNPNLKAETAVGREVGFDWQPLDWVQAKGTWYVAEYDNFNVPVTLTTNKPAACGTAPTCRQRLNVNKSRSQGGEAYLALRPIEQLFVSAGVNYDDARQQSGLPVTATDNTKPHINRVPSPKQTIRATWSSPRAGDLTAIWRHEGRTTTLGGIGLEPYTVVDANAQRELLPGIRAFLSVENVFDKKYQVNISGTGASTNPFIISNGLPRTVRVGMEAYRF